jgi:hypothetical protein
MPRIAKCLVCECFINEPARVQASKGFAHVDCADRIGLSAIQPSVKRIARDKARDAYLDALRVKHGLEG